MTSNLIEIIQRKHQRAKVHRHLLETIFNTKYQDLFSQLGIKDYKIIKKVIEPKPVYDKPTPDLLFLYLAKSWNLLLVEVKGIRTGSSIRYLEDELALLESLVHLDKDRTYIYQLFEGAVPLKVLQNCRIQIAGIYGTKTGNFRVYRFKEIADRVSYAATSNLPAPTSH